MGYNPGTVSRSRRHAVWRRRLRWPVTVAGILLLSFKLPMVSAAYVASTSTGVNTFTSGTVAISATAAGSKVFSVTDAIAGSTATVCVITTYTGTLPATVRMFFPAASGTLGTYLAARVQSGTGTQSDCSDFGSATMLYNASTAPLAATDPKLGTLVNPAVRGNYASAIGDWAATQNATRAWKFEYLLPTTDAAKGTSFTFTTTWEARS